MELLLSIILLVFAVLQIVLFFKVWGMTNDVKKIKEKQREPKLGAAKVAYLRGDKDLAHILLDEYFFESARGFVFEQHGGMFNNLYARLVDQCSPIYEEMELESPDFEKYKNKEELTLERHKAKGVSEAQSNQAAILRGRQ